MTKKKAPGTLLKRGRKAVQFSKSPKSGMINVSLSMSGHQTFNKKTGKMKRAKIIEKRAHWVESVGVIGDSKANSAMINKALRQRADVLSHIMVVRGMHAKVFESFPGGYNKANGITFGKGSRLPNKWQSDMRRFAGAGGLKSKLQQYLRMIDDPNGKKSSFLMKNRAAGTYNLGFANKEAREQWHKYIGDTKRVMTGIRNFDIRRAVKSYGKGIIPSTDITVYRKNSKGQPTGEVLRVIQSVAKTGVWWRDVKRFDKQGNFIGWERKLNKDIEERLFVKMKAKAKAKFDKRHAADPLMGTRKRGRKTYEMSSWTPAFVKNHKMEAWALAQAHKEGLLAMKKIAAKSNNFQRFKVPEGVKSKVEKIRRELIRNVEIATLSAQAQLMRELEYVKAWNNLTGNAYTGIMSAAFVTTDRVTIRKVYEQLPGVKSKRATRGKLSQGIHKQYKRTVNGKKQNVRTGASVYVGRRYDRPSEYFYIKDRGQFTKTSGGYAYDEALNLLNQFNPRMNTFSNGQVRKLKGIVASLKVVSGSPEYINTLQTATGTPFMAYALQRAVELLKEKTKHLM